MATSIATQPNIQQEITYYNQMVNLHDHLPVNTGLSSARQETMISLLGSPKMPLTTVDQPSHASPMVRQLLQTVSASHHVVVTGIRPAIDSLKAVLIAAFAQERLSSHDLDSVLSTDGMLNVRLRKPTSGLPSTKISNHSWGTAVDLKIIGHSSLGNTGDHIPRYIAVLLPFFHAEGWYSGIGFHDTMHFEVAEQTIRRWQSEGRL